MKKKFTRNISGFFRGLVDVATVDEETEEIYFASDDAEAIPVFNQFYIKEVLYNNPVTVVFWSDGTKTVAKTHGGDVYSKETGLTVCVLKKLVGTSTVRELFEDWIVDANRVSIKNVRHTLRIPAEMTETKVEPVAIKTDKVVKKKVAPKKSTTKKSTKKG